ncbi:MAG: hypothetical protein PHF37_00955 [Phycisphaerae bacterium]|nr:hypothetical protein [Phycisphaerae bacterium]
MSLNDDIIHFAKNKPIELRNTLIDKDVADALGNIGIVLKELELHAPSRNARKIDGVGQTLCGIKGTLHQNVTCKRCLKKLG